MKIRIPSLIVLLLLISACSQVPVFSVEVITPPAPATATPIAAGSDTTSTSPAPAVDGTQPEPTQEVLEKPVGLSPVLYGGKLYDSTFFLLLGGVGMDEWLTPEESVARFSGEVTYSLNSLTQESKYFLWGETPEFSPTCRVYTVGTEAMLDEGGFVAVVDG